jgi:hypothetical protein
MTLLVSWDSDSLVVESVVDGDVQLRFVIEESGDAVRKVVHVTRDALSGDGDKGKGRLVVNS